MRVLLLFVCTMVVIQLASAQTAENSSLIDRIRQLDGNNLRAYTDPLMTSLGVALGTGIFYTASTHDVLGFDVSFRYMRVGIPSSARYFTATAVACSLANGQLDCYDVVVEDASTIFGPGEVTWVPTSGNTLAVPPVFPGGLDVTSLPFVMPQINVGLPFGLQLSLGYIPLAITFPLNQESRLFFFRVGGKLGFNKLPFLKKFNFPCALAFGGFYQRGGLRSENDVSAVTVSLWNVQFLASRRFSLKAWPDVEPFLAGGIEGAKFNFRYDFQKVLPDTIAGVPTDSIIVIEPIDIDYRLQNRLRAIIGATFYLGPIYIHYDYNILTYKAHNLMLGISIR